MSSLRNYQTRSFFLVPISMPCIYDNKQYNSPPTAADDAALTAVSELLRARGVMWVGDKAKSAKAKKREPPSQGEDRSWREPY